MKKFNEKMSFLVLATFLFTVVLGGSGWGEGIVVKKTNSDVSEMKILLLQRSSEAVTLGNIGASKVANYKKIEFQSEREFIPTFAYLGAICGAAYSLNGLLYDKSWHDTLGAFGYAIFGVFIFVAPTALGAVIGRSIDDYQFNNSKVGWINNSMATKYEDGVSRRADVVVFNEDANVYDNYSSTNVVGLIKKGEYRRKMESKTLNGEIMLKVKIIDRAIFVK